MNTRAYLTILRPWRTLFAILLNLSPFFVSAFPGFHYPLSLTWFVATVLVGPLAIGAFLLGPLHETMHTTLAAVIPGLHRAAARWHLAALAVALVALTITSAFANPRLPWQADAGLIATGLALPLLNGRRELGARFRAGVPAMILLALVLACFGAAPLYRLGVSEPWLVCAAGAAIALLCVRRGFDLHRVRARARGCRPVYCYQSALFTNGLVGRAQLRSVMHQRNSQIQIADTVWRRDPVDGSTRSWLVLMHRVTYPGRRQLAKLVTMVCVGPLFFLATVCAVAATVNGGKIGGLAAQMADICARGLEFDRLSSNFFMLPLVIGLLGTMAITSVTWVRHKLDIPLSRGRQGDLMATHRQVTCLAIFGLSSATLTVGLFVLLGLSGQALRWGDLNLPVACLLALLPTVLFLLGLSALANSTAGFVVVALV